MRQRKAWYNKKDFNQKINDERGTELAIRYTHSDNNSDKSTKIEAWI